MIGEFGMRFVRAPLLRGPLAAFTHHASAGVEGDGPFVEIWLLVEDGVIMHAAFRTHGCPSSVAAAGALCQVVAGRAVERAAELTPGELILIVGGLPESKRDMATRAIEALRKAIVEEKFERR